MAKEQRLIDANALSALFDERNTDSFMQYKTRENKAYWWGVNSGINWGTNTITDAPTVDAVPVVHGRWVYEPVEFTYEKDIKCSVCGAYVDHVTRYCPNCGAKMDGERKDND